MFLIKAKNSVPLFWPAR